MTAAEQIQRRLRLVGIDPFTIPAQGGIDHRGYWTVVEPFSWTAARRNGWKVPTVFHPWKIPADTVMGILAATKAYYREVS